MPDVAPDPAINEAMWDERVPIHVASAFYDVAGFRAGASSLKPLELAEVGDVAGKSLLHLQCHFGMDTLSWARLGARATGADFSGAAIAQARALAAELGLDARFVQSDLYALPDALDEAFDVVFTSYGVLCWLPDIRRWAEVVARFVKPGGFFYIAEQHPLSNVWEARDGRLTLAYDYFRREALQFEGGGSYADATAVTTHNRTVEFLHPLGAIVSALAAAGLRIEFLHEFPELMFDMYPGLMEPVANGFFRLSERPEGLPLLFSLKASKPVG